MQQQPVVIRDEAEKNPLAELRDFITNQNKKSKKKHGTKTKRDGVRPCPKCMHKAIEQCALCCASLRATFRPPALCSARTMIGGLEIILTNDLGHKVKLCESCTKSCARSYQQLGNKQWDKALGTAEHCATCEPGRHPKIEDMKDFKRNHFATLRKDKEGYSQTSRQGFASQQKILGKLASEKSERSRTNLSRGRTQPSTSGPGKTSGAGIKKADEQVPPGPPRKQTKED